MPSETRIVARAVLVIVLMPYSVTSEDGIYRKTHSYTLREPPHDIPSRAEKIYLNNNIISTIPSGAFAKNIVCIKLDLGYNRLTGVGADMWTGLESLKWFFLEYNNIPHIEPLAFANLPDLEELYLDGNKLKVLSQDIFQFGSDPIEILSIKGNPLHQDSRLCWIQKGQDDGWIKWMTPQELKTKEMIYCTDISEHHQKEVTEPTITPEDETTNIFPDVNTTKTITKSVIQPKKDKTQHTQLGNIAWILPLPVVYGIFVVIIIAAIICCLLRYLSCGCLATSSKNTSKSPAVLQLQSQSTEERSTISSHPSLQQLSCSNGQQDVELSQPIDDRPPATLPVGLERHQPSLHNGKTRNNNRQKETETRSQLGLQETGDRPVSSLPPHTRRSNPTREGEGSGISRSNCSSIRDSVGSTLPVTEGSGGLYSYAYDDKRMQFAFFLECLIQGMASRPLLPPCPELTTSQNTSNDAQASGLHRKYPEPVTTCPQNAQNIPPFLGQQEHSPVQEHATSSRSTQVHPLQPEGSIPRQSAHLYDNVNEDEMLQFKTTTV